MLLEGGVRLAYPYIANYNLEMWRYFAEIKRPLSQEKPPLFPLPQPPGELLRHSIENQQSWLSGKRVLPSKASGYQAGSTSRRFHHPGVGSFSSGNDGKSVGNAIAERRSQLGSAQYGGGQLQQHDGGGAVQKKRHSGAA